MVGLLVGCGWCYLFRLGLLELGFDVLGGAMDVSFGRLEVVRGVFGLGCGSHRAFELGEGGV
mgnify:CR=1 FL=1